MKEIASNDSISWAVCVIFGGCGLPVLHENNIYDLNFTRMNSLNFHMT